MISFTGLCSRVFNLNKGEWNRVSLSWFLNLFYRISFVTAWTVIVGMFVAHYGILMLPFLFVANAVLSIIGSLFYSTFIGKISKEKTIFLTIVASFSFLLLAILLRQYSEVLFFVLLLAVVAIFLVQLKIIINGFVETLFNPLESERTFPFIESAETIGGILAGGIVVYFSGIMNPSDFVYVLMVSLVCVPLCFVFKEHKVLSLGGGKAFMKKILKSVDENEESEVGGTHMSPRIGLSHKMKDVFSQVKEFSFIKGLFLVVLLQWVFANLIELQYTRAVYNNVSEVVLTSGSGFEHAFIHDLGALFILFSAVALFFQLVVGGRLISSLGVVGSMLLYPIVMIFSVFGLTLHFGFPTAVLSQTNKNITQVLHANAYHSAYYSIKKHFREHVREFLEGMVRPVGALLGTLVAIGFQSFFSGDALILSVNIAMIFVLGALFFVTHGLQSEYTHLACYNLAKSGANKADKIEAIDILSQKGHKLAVPVLRGVLYDHNESDFVRMRVLRAFGELKDPDTIDDIINSFKSNNTEERLVAVEVLFKFYSLKDLFFKDVFREYKMIESLKSLYSVEKNDEIKSLVLRILSRLNPVGTFGFLVNVLRKSRGDIKSDAIMALGAYKNNHVLTYIKPFLSSRDLKERSAAIISLWRCCGPTDDLEIELDRMLSSKNSMSNEAACYIVGELKLKSKIKRLKYFLKSSDRRLKVLSSLALAKMGHLNDIGTVVELLFDGKGVLFEEVSRSLKTLPDEVSADIEKEVSKIVSAKIDSLLSRTKNKSFQYLDTKSLKYLKMLYSLVGEDHEVETLNELLYLKKQSCSQH